MPRRAYRIAALLFLSGLCALVYQVAWLRELRLVFGASTPATSAVLAVFMGGLGYGSLKLGRRAEAVKRPLHFYGNLEAGIALTAAISPLLLDLARRAYVVTGGTTALGMVGGTLVRLLLSAIVLLPPTLLMGGTLPAAARAASWTCSPTVGWTCTVSARSSTVAPISMATVPSATSSEACGPTTCSPRTRPVPVSDTSCTASLRFYS